MIPKAVIHLKRRNKFLIEAINRLNGLFANLVNEEA